MTQEHVRERLEAEFGNRFAPGTVDRFVDQAFVELQDHAAVDTWVPVLAEKFARQQLMALARIEGHDDSLPVVLFLDVHDAGRSQLARALFGRHAAGTSHAWSGGFSPAHEIHSQVGVALAPFEIDLAHEYPKPVTPEVIRGADVIVVLGDIPSELPEGKRVIAWDVPPLDGMSDEAAIEVGRQVDGLAESLAAELLADSDGQ